ncbi:MAG: putative DNA-binding protein (MmcQ/YjbR family) [Bradymonadia bacterium]|jgi:predicted DNA-binding protein (MmcQ/YjbR family)
MDLEAVREYCLSLPATTEGFPFGPEILVFKVCGKMFATLSFDDPPRMNLKFDPDAIEESRVEFECLAPGYHMNKKHWNTATLDSSVPSETVEDWIGESWRRAGMGLKKADRVRLGIQ